MLINKSPISASYTEDTTCFIIYATANSVPLWMLGLLASKYLSSKKCPLTRLLDFGADKYDASLCTFSATWLPWNLIVGFGCVAQ